MNGKYNIEDILKLHKCEPSLNVKKTIMEHYKNIPFIEILEWATLNGAKALSIDHLYGSIEIGKQPGLNLINQFDFTIFAPSKESSIKVLK